MVKGFSVTSVVCGVLMIMEGYPLFQMARFVGMFNVRPSSSDTFAQNILYAPMVVGIFGISAGVSMLLKRRWGAFLALGAAIFSGIFGLIWGEAMSGLGPLAPRELQSVALVSAVLFVIAAVVGIKNIPVKSPSASNAGSQSALTEKKFCTNCGSPLDPSAKFCAKCGVKVPCSPDAEG